MYGEKPYHVLSKWKTGSAELKKFASLGIKHLKVSDIRSSSSGSVKHYLGIKNIRLGPSLPAFITPNILKVLVEKFNIIPITTPEEDMKAIMQ